MPRKRVKLKMSWEEYERCLREARKEVLQSLEALAKKILEKRFK